MMIVDGDDYDGGGSDYGNDGEPSHCKSAEKGHFPLGKTQFFSSHYRVSWFMKMVLVVYYRLFFDGFQKKFSFKYLVSVPSSKSEVKRYLN